MSIVAEKWVAFKGSIIASISSIECPRDLSCLKVDGINVAPEIPDVDFAVSDFTITPNSTITASFQLDWTP